MDYRICDIPDGGNEPEETKEVSIDFLNAVDWLITLH